MANVLIPILAGNLPTNYCFPASPQQLLNDFAATMSALLPGGMAYYNYGDTAPAVQYQGYPWLYTNTMRWYQYVGGLWISPHPYPASGGARIMFTTGAESDIWDFDGGDGNDPGAVPPTTYTGAMWEADSDFAGRSPMHPGNISGSSPLKNLAETENYGEGNHALVQAELPNVNWNLNVNSLSQAPGAGAQDGLLYQQPGTGSGNVAVPPSLIVSSGGTNTPHQTVHPVRGVWIIRRTARAYYTAP